MKKLLSRRELPLLFLGASKALSAQAAKGSSLIRSAIMDPIDNVIFPQVADGNGWTTTFNLLNMGNTQATYRLTFGAPDGTDLTIGIAGIGPRVQLSGTLPVNGSAQIETAGIGALQQGFAILSTAGVSGTTGIVSGVAIFRERVQGRPDFEASVPASPLSKRRMRLMFDNTNGYATGCALVNIAPSTSLITAFFYQPNGTQLGSGTFTLPAFGQKAFALASQFPALAG